MDFKELLNTTEYSFLRDNPRLGNRIMLLGVSGSYGYGTNREGSDIDFRGVTLNLPSDLIGLTTFDQYEDTKTDTVIYSFNKLVNGSRWISVLPVSKPCLADEDSAGRISDENVIHKGQIHKCSMRT